MDSGVAMNPAAVTRNQTPSTSRISDEYRRVADATEIAIREPGRAEEIFERGFNSCVAFIALIITTPLWIAVAILVKITSPGPILYSQTRVGIDRRRGTKRNDPRRKQDIGGRPFTIYKFRTMRVDAERHTGPVWAAKHDPRVTPIGRWLRQFRLDELPQLLNVIQGDMNIVGPRPERPTFFAELRREIANYHLRQRTKPGLTGNAQINLEYDSSVDDVRRKLEFDLAYLRRRSLLHDMSIMVRTIPVILFRRGSR
ncbi:MAG: sugar transferase [Gemmatimonadota bacterium]